MSASLDTEKNPTVTHALFEELTEAMFDPALPPLSDYVLVPARLVEATARNADSYYEAGDDYAKELAARLRACLAPLGGLGGES